MIDRIAEFFIDAASVDADLMVVATTRPQGYSAEFSPDQYHHLHLMPLTGEQAEAFARKLADVRLADDPDSHANVIARVNEAAKDPLTARLMVTPLQVTIMSLLLEGRARVPQDRYSLFADYYRTIYSREVAKDTATARLLDQHRRTVDQLHEHVGLLLQIQAETSGKADAALPAAEIEALAREILNKEDYPSGEAQRLAEQIAAAATTRLVLLVPKHIDDVGFDVRSLQELMAARSLTTGPDERIMAKLRAIALSAHWRNTFLLAAGRVTSDRDHLVDAILILLDDLETGSYLTMYLRLAAGVALDLLDDRFAAPSPRVETKLAHKAIGVLQSPPTVGVWDAADILQRATLTGSALLGGFVADAARTSLAADPPQRITAAMMMRRWTRSTGALAGLGRQRTKPDHAELGQHTAVVGEHYLTRTGISQNLGKFRRSRRRGAAAIGSVLEGRTVAHYFTADIGPATFDAEDTEAWNGLLRALAEIPVIEVGSSALPAVKDAPNFERTLIDQALTRPAVMDHLAEQLLVLDPDHWAMASTVADLIRNVLQSRPVGETLHP